jgi:hypothetical protein
MRNSLLRMGSPSVLIDHNKNASRSIIDEIYCRRQPSAAAALAWPLRPQCPSVSKRRQLRATRERFGCLRHRRTSVGSPR